MSCADSESELFSFGSFVLRSSLVLATKFVSFTLTDPLLFTPIIVQFIWQFDLLVTDIIYDLCVLMNNNELQFIYLAKRERETERK